MLRYRLRTLLIVLALGPPVLAGAWWGYGKWRESRKLWLERQLMRQMPPDVDLPILSIPTEKEWEDLTRRRRAAGNR